MHEDSKLSVLRLEMEEPWMRRKVTPIFSRQFPKALLATNNYRHYRGSSVSWWCYLVVETPFGSTKRDAISDSRDAIKSVRWLPRF